MPKNFQRVAVRTAIWRANGKRCIFCEEPISFRDLEVDHLIPRSIGNDDLVGLVGSLGLPADFSLDDLRNLVPTHHSCNSRKGARKFSERGLRFYCEVWGAKQADVTSELNEFEREAQNDHLISQLIHQIERGRISITEIQSIVEGNLGRPSQPGPRAPMIVALGVNLATTKWASHSESKERFHEVASRFENAILEKLRTALRRPIILTEPSARTGETISIRFAVWSVDVNRIEEMDLSPWEVLEIAPSTDIYASGVADLFDEAVRETFDIFAAERHGCPECGGEVRIDSFGSDSGEYAFGLCKDCGWERHYP